MELADFNQTLENITGLKGVMPSAPNNDATLETLPVEKNASNNNSTIANPNSSDSNSPNTNSTDTFTPPEANNSPADIDVDDVWKILYAKLKMHISEREMAIWYKGVFLVKVENGVAELSSDNPIKKEWILNNHRMIIKNMLAEIIGQTVDIQISIRTSINSESAVGTRETRKDYEFIDPSKLQQSGQESLFNGNSQSGNGGQFNTSTSQHTNATTSLDPMYQANLNYKYTLSTFIVGGNNQLAYAVAESVINQPGTLYNPVFFYGPSGVGKTHLMQAVGNAMRVQNPLSKIIYVPIETFMNELIEGIRTGGQEAFRQKYRAADLLIIDDIQFISTYKKTQEEMFNTFNALYQDGKQIVIASDRPPKEIENLPDRLRTRFEGGMVVDIQAPDLETRIAICRQKINEHKGASVDNELVMFIAQNIQSSVRELEGAITKVIAHQKFSAIPITLEDVAKMLQLDLDTKRARIKPEAIINAVCEIFDVTTRDIRGKRRTAHVALTRQIVMYLLREELELPLERIAKEVNRSDHTTVIHACNKIEELLATDERFKAKVEKVLNLVKG